MLFLYLFLVLQSMSPLPYPHPVRRHHQFEPFILGRSYIVANEALASVNFLKICAKIFL